MKLGVLVLSAVLASATGVGYVAAVGNRQSEIEKGKGLVESKISCDQIKEDQLKAIGEYFMERMHPGDAHDAMHKRMGLEERTEDRDRLHMNMARKMYCGKGGMMGQGMMKDMMDQMKNRD